MYVTIKTTGSLSKDFYFRARTLPRKWKMRYRNAIRIGDEMYANRYYSSLHHCGRATVKRFLAFSDMWKTIKTFSMKSKHTFTVISWSPRRVGRNGQGTIFNTMNKLCRIVGSKMYFTKMCSFRWKFLRIVSHKTRVWTQTRNIRSYVFMCVAVINHQKRADCQFPDKNEDSFAMDP